MNYIHIGFQRGSLGEAEFYPRLNDLNRLASPSSLPRAIWLGNGNCRAFLFALGPKEPLQL